MFYEEISGMLSDVVCPPHVRFQQVVRHFSTADPFSSSTRLQLTETKAVPGIAVDLPLIGWTRADHPSSGRMLWSHMLAVAVSSSVTQLTRPGPLKGVLSPRVKRQLKGMPAYWGSPSRPGFTNGRSSFGQSTREDALWTNSRTKGQTFTGRLTSAKISKYGSRPTSSSIISPS